MNKLTGFYELKSNGLPSVDWKQYNPDTVLDDHILWTIRSAVEKGNDLNLPRLIGVTAAEAKAFADGLLKKFTPYDMVIYYPYFIAEKSGVMEIALNKTVIEGVQDDLWNFVTYNKKDVTLILSDDDTEIIGNKAFFQTDELSKLLSYVNMIKNKYRDYILEGKSVFLEWSFAYKSSVSKEKIGEKKLVFYEIRTV